MDSQSKIQNRSDDDQRVLEVLDQYLLDQEHGKAPDIEQIIAAHPEMAERLRYLFESLTAVEDFGNSIRAARERVTPEKNFPVLEDYRIVRELGRGGMGVVYEAEQISLARRVALKVLPLAAVFDQKHLQRFKNEVLATAQFDHPNIINVYSVGCEKGIHFYAMQLIEGQSLAELIRSFRATATPSANNQLAPQSTAHSSGPVSLANAADSNETGPAAILSTRTSSTRTLFQAVASLGADAANALHHAHQLGIVHRDIKPSNLLVDGRGKVHVSDFGLATMQSDANLTASGDLVGTLRYMSPEQASGKPELVDHRTDIYSLGATLYELMTCRSVVESDDRKEILRSILEEKIMPPSRINRGIPRDLDMIVMKALSWEREHRYVSAMAFAEDLQRFVDDQPVLARRPPTIQRLSMWTRRNRWVALTVAASVLLLLAGSTISSVIIYRWYDKAVAAEAELKVKNLETSQALLRAQTAEGELGQKNEHLLRVLARVEEADDRVAEMPILLIERGQDFFGKEQFRAAFDMYETALKLNGPQSALCQLLMSRASYELYDFEAAVALATSCIDETAELNAGDFLELGFSPWEPYYERARAKMTRVPPPSTRIRGVDCGERFSWWNVASLKQANHDVEMAAAMVPENLEVFKLYAKTKFNLGQLESNPELLKEASEMARSYLDSNFRSREMVEIRLLSFWNLRQFDAFKDEAAELVDPTSALRHGHLAMLRSLYHHQSGDHAEGKRWYSTGLRQMLYRESDYDYHERCVRNMLIASASWESGMYFDAWNDVETWLSIYRYRIDSSDLLSRISKPSLDTLYLQSNMNSHHGPHWTPEDKHRGSLNNGIHLFWRPSEENRRLAIDVCDTQLTPNGFTSFSPGRHRLITRLTKSNDFAIVQLWWNAKRIGDPIDLYNEYPTQDGELDMGWVELVDGKNTLVIEIVDTNPNVTRALAVGIDSIDLWPEDYLPGRSLNGELSRRFNNFQNRWLQAIESSK